LPPLSISTGFVARLVSSGLTIVEHAITDVNLGIQIGTNDPDVENSID